MLENTKKVFDTLKNNPEIANFVLVGGTALSMIANHRLSEDLDFALIGKTLKKSAIKQIIGALPPSFDVVKTHLIADAQSMENEGMDIDDYHQDWMINGVKVTFFVIGDSDKERDLIAAEDTKLDGYAKVMEMPGLFLTKCIALCNRIKSRDLFDLWWMGQHDQAYDVKSIFSSIQEMRPHMTYEAIRYRLLDWAIPVTDEGLQPLTQVTIEDVRTRLKEQVRILELDYLNAEHKNTPKIS